MPDPLLPRGEALLAPAIWAAACATVAALLTCCTSLLPSVLECKSALSA